MADDWQQRVDVVWADAADLSDTDLVSAIDALAAERDPGDAVALAERGGARDSTGLEEEAVPFYRAALAAGLDDERRGQVVIQYASTVRNLGRPEESLELLAAEFAGQPDHPLGDAATAFAALALASQGRTTDALVAALHALAPHLPRYQRAVGAYADELLEAPRPTSRLRVGSIVIRVTDLAAQKRFWMAALDYLDRPGDDDDFALLRPRDGRGPNVSLDQHPSQRVLPPRIHLDLYANDQAAEVARLEGLGAERVHWDRQPDDSDYVIMQDPEGNRFCVIDAS